MSYFGTSPKAATLLGALALFAQQPAHGATGTPARRAAASAPSDTAADTATDYCKRVAARARSRAALDFAPEAMVQGIRIPLRSSVDPDAISAENGYQLRAGFSLSPLNIYRGALVLGLAEKQCQRHLIEQQLEETIESGLDTFRLPALVAQRDYLRGKLPRVDAAVARARQQLEAKVITVLELRGVTERAITVRHKLLLLERQILAIENSLGSARQGGAISPASIAQMVRRYTDRALEVEETESSIRKLSAYTVRATGGAVVESDPGWFGIVELRYNFGGPFQLFAESSYLDARANELRRAQHELSGRALRLARLLERSQPLFRDELALVGEQLEAVVREDRALRETNVPKRDYRLAVLELEATYLEGEQIYLRQVLATTRAEGTKSSR